MTKTMLIKKIAADADISHQQAIAVIHAFTATVARSLKKGHFVTLVGFGSFSLLHRAATRRRNPRTGALMRLRARRTAKFNASPILTAKL